jgi:hypothetical protein
MPDNAPIRKRGNSRPNVKRRGSTYTYYVYITDANGARRQHSKGGFRTQRAAEEARIEALSALANAAYVKSERTSVGRFLTDEWLPSRRPPVLEESTWRSYERYIRLHVVPHVGNTPLHMTRLTRGSTRSLQRFRTRIANGYVRSWNSATSPDSGVDSCDSPTTRETPSGHLWAMSRRGPRRSRPPATER